jgi:hypothetical protein
MKISAYLHNFSSQFRNTDGGYAAVVALVRSHGVPGRLDACCPRFGTVLSTTWVSGPGFKSRDVILTPGAQPSGGQTGNATLRQI